MTRARFLRLVENFRRARVLVVGDFVLDQFIWGDVNRISPEAPVPVVQVRRESFMPGGALNVAHNMHTLGGRVFPCGVIGRDLLGRMLVKLMKKNSVDASGVIYDGARPTTHKTRIIAHSQQVVRFDRELIQDISGQDLARVLKYAAKKITEVDGVIIEDYGKGMITPHLIQRIVKLAKRHKKFVLVDPKEKHFPYYRGVTAITPNRKEAYGALGLQDAERVSLESVAAQLIRKLRCEMVLITLGEQGIALFESKNKGQCIRIPTAAREVFDVSGAGDTVVAVFALCLASGASPREAAFVSNLAAGIVVGKLGTATVSPVELMRSFSPS